MLLDFTSDIIEKFWPEAFNTSIDILDQTSSLSASFYTPQQVLLRVYHGTREDYSADLSYWRTFAFSVFCAILLQKYVRSSKHTNRKLSGIFFRLHLWKHSPDTFPDTQMVVIVRNFEYVDFYKDDDSLQACPQNGTFIFLSDHETGWYWSLWYTFNKIFNRTPWKTCYA